MADKSKKPGAAASAPAEKQTFSLISNAALLALYRDLLQCRRAAHSVTGGSVFDALPAGVMMDLGDGDAAVSAVADPTLRLRRKGKPAVAGAASLGAGLGSVLGAALLAKARKSRKVGVIFDADASSPDWADALALAREHWLPLIFVSRAAEPDERAHQRELRKPRNKKPTETEGHLPRVLVDSNDVVAVYRVAHEAIDRARRGRGATWIEGIPFNPEGKRRAPDAATNMEQYLRGKGLLG
jgi:hypothetical protein